MSYRQPKYIAPADANIAIDKFNDSMKAFADEAKSQRDAAFCRDNPGACEDDDRDSDSKTKTSTSAPTTSANPAKALAPPTTTTTPTGKLQLLNNPKSNDMEKYMINQEAQFRK